MEVKVGDKMFKVRELLAIELDKAIEEEDKKQSLKMQVTLSANLSDEEYEKLTVKERLAIINAMNKINGAEDFQKGDSQ